MDQTRRFRIPLVPVLLLFAAAAVAVNVPAAWYGPPTEAARRAEVFSAFANLTAEPGEGGFAFTETVADLSGQTARVHRERRAHVLPGLLEAYADRIDMPADWLRGAVLDPDYAHPFDISTLKVSGPEFAAHGRQGRWHWGLAASGAENLAPGDADMAWCARWLLAWDEDLWVFAPVGTEALHGMLAKVAPELAEVARAEGGDCEG